MTDAQAIPKIYPPKYGGGLIRLRQVDTACLAATVCEGGRYCGKGPFPGGNRNER